MTPTALGASKTQGISCKKQEIEDKKMTSKYMSKIKLPAFLYSSLQTWWLMCKSIFSTYRIKGPAEKYNHMVVALPADVTSKLLYILSFPMEETADHDPRLNMLKGVLFQ